MLKKLVLVQIPKTGTKTLTAILTKIYGKQGLWKDPWEEHYHKELFWGVRDTWPLPTYKAHRQYNCIVGSFPLSKYQHLKDEGWLFASWMRDPIERRISWYNNNSINKTQRKFWDYPNEPSDIISFIKKMKNVYKLYYDVDILDFVGFTETFNESCSQLYRLLRVKGQPPNIRRNVTPEKRKVEVTDEQREIMRKWLDEEYKIYNEAKELWLNQK